MKTRKTGSVASGVFRIGFTAAVGYYIFITGVFFIGAWMNEANYLSQIQVGIIPKWGDQFLHAFVSGQIWPFLVTAMPSAVILLATIVETGKAARRRTR